MPGRDLGHTQDKLGKVNEMEEADSYSLAPKGVFKDLLLPIKAWKELPSIKREFELLIVKTQEGNR